MFNVFHQTCAILLEVFLNRNMHFEVDGPLNLEFLESRSIANDPGCQTAFGPCTPETNADCVAKLLVLLQQSRVGREVEGWNRIASLALAVGVLHSTT